MGEGLYWVAIFGEAYILNEVRVSTCDRLIHGVGRGRISGGLYSEVYGIAHQKVSDGIQHVRIAYLFLDLDRLDTEEDYTGMQRGQARFITYY